MKRFFAIVVALLFVIIFININALGSQAVYIDDLSRLENTTGKQYENLKSASQGDFSKGAVGVALANSTLGKGSVVYRIQGGVSVSASLYSAIGTGVSVSSKGEYRLGAIDLKDYDPTTRSVFSQSMKHTYITKAGKVSRMYYDEAVGEYLFVQTDENPLDLVNYGVAFFVSSDGKTYTELTAVMENTNKISEHMRKESWAASIPTGVTYLKVQLNDTPTITYRHSGQVVAKSLIMQNKLAEVKIYGDGLIIGIPEPTQSEEVITSKPQEDEKEKSSKASGEKETKSSGGGAKASGESVKDGEPKKETSQGSSSKFEGVIPDEKSSVKSGNTKGKSSTTASDSKESDSEETEDKEELAEKLEQEKYFVAGESAEKDNFTVGVIIYIVVVCGFILFILLKPKK